MAADPAALDGGGWWAVVATFEGAITGYRFGSVRAGRRCRAARRTGGRRRRAVVDVDGRAGTTCAAWQRIRRYIEAGDVYQVNLCRLLPHDDRGRRRPVRAGARLAAGNPAPYQGVLDLGDRTGW